MKKILFIVIALMSVNTFAQSQKMKDKAMEKVVELNEMIVSVDTTLKLSDQQMAEIMKLEIDKTKSMRTINKGDESEEKKKELKKIKRKEFQAALKEVLSKKQLKALRQAKKENKE